MLLNGTKKIYRLIKFIFQAKIDWKIPKPSKILIYDANGIDLLFHYIDADEAQILHTRGEQVNIPSLLLSKFTISSYIDRYIKFTKPKFVVTFTDNSKSFYLLKSKHPKVIFISIQNGLRGVRDDIFKDIHKVNDKMTADYLLTFNMAVGEEYLKYISANNISIGSLKNNYYPKIKTKKNNSIVFISQYVNPPKGGEDIHFQFANKTSISWNQVYNAEREVLGYLSEFCISNNLQLKIAGRQINSSKELEFYRKNLNNFNKWEMIQGNYNGTSYELIDNSSYVIGIDSTLLYEAFARGAKVAFFSCRGSLVGEKDVGRFAWPSPSNDSGPFWANKINKAEFNRIMNYIIEINDYDWRRDYLRYLSLVMDYDPGNNKMIELFKLINLPLNPRYV